MNEKINNINNLEIGDFVSLFFKGSEISGDLPLLVIEKFEDEVIGLNHSGRTYVITQESEVTLQIPSHYVEDVYFFRLRQYFDSLRELKENS